MINWTTIQNTDEYKNRRYDLLLRLEEQGTAKLTPYNDNPAAGAAGNVTMGVGFNLEASAVRAEVFRTLGLIRNNPLLSNVPPAPGQLSARQVENNYIDQLISAIASASNDFTQLHLTMVDRANDPRLDALGTRRTAFQFLDFPEIQTTFDRLMTTIYEPKIDSWLSGIPESRERLALASLAWNQKDSNPLLGAGLRRALLDSQGRSEAWYEIRYNSNSASQATNIRNGIAKRRYYESGVFGLFENPSAPTPAEAEQAYRALQLHREEILKYEAQFGAQVNNANTDYHLVGGDRVLNLTESYAEARNRIVDALQAQYTSLQMVNLADVAATSILLDSNRDLATQALDPNHSGVLNARELVNGVEQSVKNILIGEGGNDVLIGGMGDDILIGGDGDDVYRWSTGDGKDKIIDSDRKGRIIINSQDGVDLIAGGYFKQINATTWQSADGFLTLTHNSPWKIITADGGELELGDTLNSGDFGMFLDDAPAAIVPTRDIVADLEPIDFDPPHLTFHTDDLGNLIVDPTQAAPGRHDQLRDSAGSDHIVSGGGSDLIELDSANLTAGGSGSNGRGGNDWIQTGDGRDAVFSGAGNDLIEGGAGGFEAQLASGQVLTSGLGGDLLAGGAGDDRIYGDSQIELAAAIDAGNTQLATGTKGDWLSGQAGEDILVTGADNDFLTGGSGADLLIGGAGDDNLLGDANWSVTDFGWFYHDEPAAPGERTGKRVFEFVVGETNPLDSGADTIYAGAGTDWVRGGRGDDVIYGEGGNDDLVGEWGSDEIFGGSGNDVIAGDAVYITNDAEHGDDYIDGGDGDDELQGDGGSDILFGGAGNDTLFGDDSFVSAPFQGADYLDGEDGNDHLEGGGGDDVLFGGAGADEMLGGNGDDSLEGETENDVAFGEAGNDYLDGGDGDDFLDGGNGDDTLLGGAGSDTLKGQAGNDYLDGGDGNDFLEGGDGDDTLIGGAGADVLNGGAGNNTIVANFADGDFVIGGPGANTLQMEYGGDVSTLSISQVFDAGGKSYLAIVDTGGNQVLIQGGFAGAVSEFDFGGVSTVTRSDLMRQAQVAALTLAGDEADEHFIGSNNADQISGGDGDDVIEGLGGDDFIDGGAGADTLQGGAGDDTYVVDDAGDAVVESAGEGVDGVQSSVTHALGAEVENLALTGTDAIDATGNALNNVLTGNAAANILDGGAGNDTLIGGFGADTYLFGRGYGQDTIQETDNASGSIDKVQFAADVAPADVAVSRTTNDLILTITATGDKLTVANYFSTSSAVVEQFRFNDGTVWNDTTIAQKLSNGTAGNDIISGTAGNDIINGLAGNDTLNGLNGDDRLFGEQGVDTLNGNNGADILDGGVDNDNLLGGNGGDTYIFARGYGQDFITETDDGTNPVDQIQFAADILSTDVTTRRNGLSLEVSINGTADKVVVNSYFNNDAVGLTVVEQLRFGDGTIWDVATVKGLVLVPTEGNDTLTGYASNDVIDGAGGNDMIDGGAGNDTLIGGLGFDNLTGGLGDDTLRGGTGNDSLSGGAGNDTYLYDIGDGQDTIFNNDSSTATTDKLIFGAGILPSDVRVTSGGTASDLFIVKNGLAIVTVSGYFNIVGGSSEVDEIRFTDDPATVWTPAGVRAMVLTGNDNANSLVGFNTDDTIDGLGGDDFIDGGDGNDTLFGGAGNDKILGSFRTDTLMGGAGDDLLYGESDFQDIASGASGGDTLDGGPGRDQLFGRRGNDIYVFGRGYGHDTIVEATFFSDGVDTLRLNAGVLPADVTLFRHADDLVVTFTGDQAQAWISQYFTLPNKPIEQIVFNDGMVWDATAIASRVIAGAQNALTGTAGNDTFVVDNVGDTITEGANQGTDTVQSSVTYTLPANVENITLTGILDISATGNTLDNTLTGNTGDNILTGGGGGNDTLIGGQGNDTLIAGGVSIGGQGDDTYVGGGGTITEAAGEGIDTVIANSGSSVFTLGPNLENLTIQSGFIFSLFVSGNELDNVILGRTNVIGDRIDGGAGADIMTSGGGIFFVDNPGDQIISTTSGSNVAVKSNIDWTLTADHSSLELLAGTAAMNGTGNAANNTLLGNERANTLSGLDGNDTLFGATGADTLIGGRGNDTFFLANFRFPQGSAFAYGAALGEVNEDTVVENAGEGVDTVNSLFDYTLTDNVENLVLLTYTGGPVIPLQATGNALANQLTGNSGANIIDGRGGADTMIGQLGNDTYYVDDAGDVVMEFSGGGIDTVIAQASFVLGAEVENLTLAGTDAISGTGNALNNVMDGSQNSAGNVLAGGLGNDTYIVGAGDTILENAGEGIDTVRSDVSYALGANVENLVLLGSVATTGTGDALDNTLDGSQNAAVNTLVGGLGNDTYLVDGGDIIVENAGEGIDTVTAAFDYMLSANIENLTLAGSAVTGTGSADANVITGNAFDNLLDGAGGADTLRGLGGNDTYVIDDAGDVIDETNPASGADAGGFDTVRVSFTYALGANLESLTLTGTAAIDGTGNSLGNLLSGNSAANVLAGGAGDDTYVVDAGDSIVENADEGTDTVQSSATYTLGANLEFLSLIGIDAIDGTGNALDNLLFGNSAANVLDGGTGSDTLIGDLGNDTYRFARGAGNDTVLEGDATAGNIDTIEMATGISPGDIIGTRSGDDLVLSISGTSDTLTVGAFFFSPDNEVERVVFSDGTVWDSATLRNMAAINGTSGADTLNGTANDDRIFGLAGNDTLNGLAGNDFLDGGAGVDTMNGSTGDDTYVVDNTSDIVTESSSSGGIDTLLSSVTRTLGSNQENLTLTGTAAINGTGNTLANVITGNSGNNTLSGGTGADTLAGGLGNDTYVVDNTGDVVTENAGEGTDLVQSSVTYTLSANAENLTLTGTSALSGTGNTLDNVLTGNSANNTLTGGAGNDTLNGGSGNDTMVGGTGNDSYFVNVTADIVSELANEGTDTVNSSVTLTLGNNVENLILTGTSTLSGTGNGLNNVLTGNSGANTLTGGAGNDTLDGGSGNDTMIGGTGDDTYFMNVATDTVTESASQGNDTIQSAATVTALANNVENLILTGSNAINGTGNTLNNLVRGNIGNNTLNGSGGFDALEGGAGNDTLTDTSGGNYYNGGAGTDTLTGGTSGDFFMGGTGNDTISTGNGADVIAFNAGDGQDSVNTSVGTDDTVSLGGAGLAYANLSFQKSANNLILNVSATDKLTFTNWYAASANKNVLNLQVVAEAMAGFNPSGGNALLDNKVEKFNFQGLVGAFDAALAANPGLTSWALTNGLTQFQLAGSDTAALGGDLAYYYGLNGTVAGIGFGKAQDVLTGTGFGMQAQTLRPLASLQDGVTPLG